MRQSVWTKKNRHKAGFLELRTGSARQAHGGVAEVGPLVHRTGVKLGILVAENAYRKVKDKFSFSGPLPITAKGYDDPVQAYTVAEKFE